MSDIFFFETKIYHYDNVLKSFLLTFLILIKDTSFDRTTYTCWISIGLYLISKHQLTRKK
jgi:hypothetical protein